VRYDPLTELPMGYGIENDFIQCQKDAKRNRHQLYVVLIDVDHFKPINDTYGQLVGDLVLRYLSSTLKHTLRSNESLYRFGGEEFLWLLKCTSARAARQSARRVLATVATTPVPLSEVKSLTLTVTLGMAQAGESEAFSSAIKRAELALSEGKQSGRNRYVVAEPSAVPG
jgi:diguanylate cyclase (GGDEF)-like protein